MTEREKVRERVDEIKEARKRKGKNSIESQNIDILHESASNKQIIHKLNEYYKFQASKMCNNVLKTFKCD